MAATYEPNTAIRQMRLLIPDRVLTDPIFQDDEINDFLALEDSLKRAVALALETIAADQALTDKVQKTGDLSIDGAAVARVLLARATTLREQAQRDDDGADGGAFDIAEMVLDGFSARERVAKQWQRGY